MCSNLLDRKDFVQLIVVAANNSRQNVKVEVFLHYL